MKKLIIIGTLILSAGAFANGHWNDNSNNNNQCVGWNNGSRCYTQNNRDNWNRGNKKHFRLTTEQKKEISKVKIALEEKKLELKKLMLENNVDWTKVQKLNQEMGNISAKLKTDMMKYKYENRQNLINQNNTNNTNNTNN